MDTSPNEMINEANNRRFLPVMNSRAKRQNILLKAISFMLASAWDPEMNLREDGSVGLRTARDRGQARQRARVKRNRRSSVRGSSPVRPQ